MSFQLPNIFPDLPEDFHTLDTKSARSVLLKSCEGMSNQTIESIRWGQMKTSEQFVAALERDDIMGKRIMEMARRESRSAQNAL